MKTTLKILLYILVIITPVIVSCNDDDNVENSSTLKTIYGIYKNGEIDECILDGKMVYVAGLNAYDAGSVVYNQDGKIIGECNYAWGKVDSVCNKTQNCEVIYRCNNHISGQPPVDKYNLSGK